MADYKNISISIDMTPKYMIGIASSILSVHPQTLRQYERLGFVKPARLDGKNRLYSDYDIEKIRNINILTKEMGVSIAGVEIIMQMQEEIMQLHAKISSLSLLQVEKPASEGVKEKNNKKSRKIEIKTL